MVGDGDATVADALPNADVLRYDELLAAESPGFDWPEIDERSAAAMCYTSGTTGNPKGVVYSHRSSFLHSLAVTTGGAMALTDRDRVVAIVPMFHANAWGLPYAAFFSGASSLMPGRFLQAEPLTTMIREERPTFSGAVPTIWTDILRYGDEHEIDLSSIRMVICGGSAVPRSLMERFEERYGMRIVQGWGMTETSPLAAVGHAPRGVELGCAGGDGLAREDRPGRWAASSCASSTTRATSCRGTARRSARSRCAGRGSRPATTAIPTPEKFHDGWLRTGDVGTCRRARLRADHRPGQGRHQVGRRVDLVGRAREPADGAPRRRRGERRRRPRSALGRAPARVRRAHARAAIPTRAALAEFLGGQASRSGRCPERWAFIDEVPKTSVGKFDKKVLRARHEKGDLAVEKLG